MASMTVSLPGDMADFVEREVRQGSYTSSGEVVSEALRLLQHEKAQEAEKLALLRGEIGLGMEAVRDGRFSKKSVADIAHEVMLQAPRR
jgi:antitoxin ParD1/3/4